MSLGKLLASGKSFVNGRSKAAYREDKRAYLPKFASQKNPFMRPVQTELPKTELPKMETKPAAALCEENVKPPLPARLAPKARVSWTSRLNPVSVWRDAYAADKTTPQPVIQSELSLDLVKVVHNDLSDAEVEIVPIKSRPARKAPDEILPAERDGHSWSRIAVKFFGSNAI